jgi:hypothetical protein
MQLLLTVDNHYLLKGQGLIITPLLDHPENITIRPFSDQVVIRPPHTNEIKLTAEFMIDQFVTDRGGGVARRVVIMFPHGTKELIPVGTQILVTQELLHYIKGELHIDTDSIVWLEPWSPINDSKTRMNVERELYKEIRQGHLLYRQPMRAIGRSQEKNIFLFEYGLSLKLAVVQLTFRRFLTVPLLPTTDIYRDLIEFIDKRMKPDHEAYTHIT